jgi:replication-associated recombination protein RarA
MDKQIFNRILDNIVFAMNLDDNIPDHIMTEIMRTTTSAEAAREVENMAKIRRFNEEVDMKLGVIQAEDDAESVFNEVYGYSDLKCLLAKMVLSDASVHAVLVGPPASGKTMFLLGIQQNMRNVFFIDATNASGPGIVEKLFSRPDTKIILIDEIEKMSTMDQNMLLNLLETQTLISTKVRKTAEMRFDGIKLFATRNDIDALSKPLRSRLIELHLPEYDFDEFQNIVIRLASERHGLDREIGEKIAFVVWHDMKTKDIRDALQLSKLITNIDDVEFLANTLQKYKRKIERKG